MALANAVQHARKRAQTITWKDEDDAAIDLTGATITGIIERAGVQTAITGALALAACSANREPPRSIEVTTGAAICPAPPSPPKSLTDPVPDLPWYSSRDLRSTPAPR